MNESCLQWYESTLGGQGLEMLDRIVSKAFPSLSPADAERVATLIEKCEPFLTAQSDDLEEFLVILQAWQPNFVNVVLDAEKDDVWKLYVFVEDD